jgi:hypothetical protein
VLCSFCHSRLLANLQEGEQYLKSLQAAADGFSACGLPYVHAEALFSVAALKVFLLLTLPLFTCPGHVFKCRFLCIDDFFFLWALPFYTSTVV